MALHTIKMKHEIDFNWRSQDNNEKKSLKERFFFFRAKNNVLQFQKIV